MKLSKAEVVSIIISLIFVVAVIIISLWSGDPNAAVSVTFQNTTSVETVAASSPSSSENSVAPSPSPSSAESSPSQSATESSGAATPSAQALININTATVQELDSLPGIGAVLAERIVAYRQEHGSFKSTGAIMNVSGIGTSKYKSIKNLIVIN